MTECGRRKVALAVAVGLIGLVGAPSANAAVTIGSNLQDAADASYNCSDTQSCTVRLADAAPTSQAPGGLISPVSGVVVRWRVNVGAFVGPLLFRIIRPAGSPGQFTGAGTSASVTPLTNSTNTFEVAMPIQAGDSIGVNCCQMGDHQIFRLVTAGQALQQTWGDPLPPLADGEPPRAPERSTDIIQLMINADIEPDCDADGLGDETQDPDTSSCNPQPEPQPQVEDTAAPDTTITSEPKAKTKKKQATFEFTGTDARAVASFQCSLDGAPFASCTSPHTVKVKKGKHTFQVRAVDQAGNIGTPASDDWKRKKKKRR